MNDLSILADAVLGIGSDDADTPMTIEDMESFELAAAALDLACDADPEPALPASLRQSLLEKADHFAATNALPRPEVVSRIGHWATWGGWMAAAATIVIAASVTVRQPSRTDPATPAFAAAVERSSDVARGAWSDWALAGDGPEIAGVTGEVAWSESSQRGYMRFASLPTPAGEGSVYQVWVIDERGLADAEGRSERISGGTFSPATATRDPQTGDLIVPINPAIDVRNAAAFAVTIEDAGGTWVSDLSRRLVIAELRS